MSHYVIGDVQGCYDELAALCSKVKFDPHKDKLIFAGDLVNRGPKSLEVLNFCIKNSNVPIYLRIGKAGEKTLINKKSEKWKFNKIRKLRDGNKICIYCSD